MIDNSKHISAAKLWTKQNNDERVATFDSVRHEFYEVLINIFHTDFVKKLDRFTRENDTCEVKQYVGNYT